MSTTSIAHTRSEKGIALVVVLLLMAVLSGLATGFAMTGHVESTMARNEVYYAGARAAAEAGMNRAIEALRNDHATDWLLGVDGLYDAADPAAAVNDDNGDIASLLTGAAPYSLDPDGQYTYVIEIFDDDDPQLYGGGALSAAQLLAMDNEDGSAYTDTNDKLILRATGYGPTNTVVRIARVLESIQTITTTPATSLNPAILVNGDLDIGGNVTITGSSGSVHTNGNLTVDGASALIAQNATASGTFSANDHADIGGAKGGGYASVNVPDIHASDYIGHADYFLNADGTAVAADGTACGTTCSAWTFNSTSGTWQITGNSAPTGTFYVYGKVSISGSPKGPSNSAIAMSIIATGSIAVTGSPKFTPENSAKYQFITDGDLAIGGAADLDDPTQVEGQILVREQIKISGNPEFQGRVLVQDATSVSTDITTNAIPGNPTFTYNGTLGALEVPGTSTTSFTNNASGWIEQ